MRTTARDVVLDNYQDTQGQAWTASVSPRGGSQIFENQSNCAFKAHMAHQLRYESEQEAEFGLDALDRGNVVHRTLELMWGRLQTQKQLKEITEPQLQVLIDQTVDQAVRDQSALLSEDKTILLQREKPRLRSLMIRWLELEAARIQGFCVTEREQHHQANIGGISFNYTIDRVDRMDDGRRLIVDYKTGAVTRRDWTSERIAKPQMPLYSVALSQAEKMTVAGIAYAKVDAKKHELIELCETGILNAENARTAKLEDQWREHSARWPVLFTTLAKQFLAGDAQVNPVEEKTCMYCDLQSVCRISQLRRLPQSDLSESHPQDSHDK